MQVFYSVCYRIFNIAGYHTIHAPVRNVQQRRKVCRSWSRGGVLGSPLSLPRLYRFYPSRPIWSNFLFRLYFFSVFHPPYPLSFNSHINVVLCVFVLFITFKRCLEIDLVIYCPGSWSTSLIITVYIPIFYFICNHNMSNLGDQKFSSISTMLLIRPFHWGRSMPRLTRSGVDGSGAATFTVKIIIRYQCCGSNFLIRILIYIWSKSVKNADSIKQH